MKPSVPSVPIGASGIGLAAALLVSALVPGPASATRVAEIQQRIVTADNPPIGSGMLAPAGVLVDLPGMAEPLNPDGVIRLIDTGGGVFSSGALIGDRHVLTAAHSVDLTSSSSFNTVGFQTATGAWDVPVDNVIIHPLYDRTVEGGYDIAVIELAQDAPADAPRYGLYTGSDELGQLSVKLGYGRTGHGSTGATGSDGNRRVGLNQYDATSTLYNSAFGANMQAGAYLLYDFDNGLAQNDTWGTHGGPVDLGFGEYEVNTTSGDSGGPTFIHDGNDWLIAGVTAWGVGLDTDPPDVTPGITDGSFGEVSADTRVSSYADFVTSVVDGTFTVPVISSFSHGNHRPALTWDRPNASGTASAGVGEERYHATSFTVDQAGVYDIVSKQNFDGIVYLYQGVADPADPLSDLLAIGEGGVDGLGNSALQPLDLQAGVTYTLITSGKDASDIGTFLNTIDGPGQAHAIASQGGLTGLYEPEQWQLESDHVDARVQFDTAPASFTLYGGDDLTGGKTDLLLPAFEHEATVHFDWTFFSEDNAGFDLVSLLIDETPVLLTTGAALYGSETITLQPGERFGIRIFTPDGANGPGVLTVDRFQVVVPEPTGMAIVLLGGLMLLRRQRASIA